MRITIDAGHVKGYNVGVISNYNEGEMSWLLSKLLGSELEKYGVEVFYSREDVTKDLALELRGKIAHDNDSDLFISLHSDGFTNPTANGVSVFYSNWRKASFNLANELGEAISSLMRSSFRGAKVKLYGGTYPNSDYYGVIRGAVGYNGERKTKNAFLIEHGFHSNPRECTWLLQKENLKALAKKEAEIIALHYKLSPVSKIYTVQVGAFADISNAENYAKELTAAGYAAYVTERNV